MDLIKSVRYRGTPVGHEAIMEHHLGPQWRDHLSQVAQDVDSGKLPKEKGWMENPTDPVHRVHRHLQLWVNGQGVLRKMRDAGKAALSGDATGLQQAHRGGSRTKEAVAAGLTLAELSSRPLNVAALKHYGMSGRGCQRMVRATNENLSRLKPGHKFTLDRPSSFQAGKAHPRWVLERSHIVVHKPTKGFVLGPHSNSWAGDENEIVAHGRYRVTHVTGYTGPIYSGTSPGDYSHVREYHVAEVDPVRKSAESDSGDMTDLVSPVFDKPFRGGSGLEVESSEDLAHDTEFGEPKFIDLDGNENLHAGHSHHIRRALADNTAELRVLGDRYVAIMAEAQQEIDKEQAKSNPSQYKIRALTNIRERAEEKLAQFKAGPDQLPAWLTQEQTGKE